MNDANQSIKISFILPVYNVSPYLSDAIESILRQNVVKEIILVDDGSTDDSLKISIDYANRHPFIYVIHSQNKGVGAARNAGLRLARGEYIFLLDPDDTLDKSLDLEKLYELAKSQNVNLIKGQHYFYQYNEPNKISHVPPIDKELQKDNAVIDRNIAFFHNALKNQWVIPNACFLIKNSFLQRNGIRFNEELSVGEDILFNIDLFSREGNMMEVSDIFFNYRIRPSSSVSSGITFKRLKDRLLFLDIIKQRRFENKILELDYLLYSVLGLHSYYFKREVEIASTELKNTFSSFVDSEMLHLLSHFSFKENNM